MTALQLVPEDPDPEPEPPEPARALHALARVSYGPVPLDFDRLAAEHPAVQGGLSLAGDADLGSASPAPAPRNCGRSPPPSSAPGPPRSGSTWCCAPSPPDPSPSARSPRPPPRSPVGRRQGPAPVPSDRDHFLVPRPRRTVKPRGDAPGLRSRHDGPIDVRRGQGRRRADRREGAAGRGRPRGRPRADLAGAGVPSAHRQLQGARCAELPARARRGGHPAGGRGHHRLGRQRRAGLRLGRARASACAPRCSCPRRPPR